MYKTEQEIFNQYTALKKTYEYLHKMKDEIKEFVSGVTYKSITFIGCGSSYSLCKSAEISFKVRSGIAVNSIAAGDLLINFSHYKNLIKDTLLIAPSRSGSTSEVVMAVKLAKEELDIPCMCICAKNDSELSRIADLSLEVPWAFDESVCQTRTVTNLYVLNLFVVGLMSGDNNLIAEINSAVENGSFLIEKYTDMLKEISSLSWDYAVVLADSELEGVAEEGALAFKEICQLKSNYHHILDIRHGPMVLIDSKTLVIIATASSKGTYLEDLINDLNKKGAVVVTVGSRSENSSGSGYNVQVPEYGNYAVMGVPFIFIPQALSFFKAKELGINPDEPQGLDPWIKL